MVNLDSGHQAHLAHSGRFDRHGDVKTHRVRVAARRLVAHATNPLYMYDMAYWQPLPDIKAAGGIAISRYFTGPTPAWQWKRVTPAQTNAALAANVGMVVNVEGSSDVLADASAKGMTPKQYGAWLANQGMTDVRACNVPAGVGVAVYFSVDTRIDPTKYNLVGDFFAGINTVIPAAGYDTKVYSQGGLIDYLCAQRLVSGKQWLAAPTSWPGFNPNSPNVCMVQLVGTPVAGTDQNKITDVSQVQAYWPPDSPYWGDDMSSPSTWTDADKAVFRSLVQAELDQGAGFGVAAPDGQFWAQTNKNLYNRTGDIINLLNQVLGAIDTAQKAILAAGVDDATKTQLDAAVTQITNAISAIPAPGSPVPFSMTLSGNATPQAAP